MIYTVTLNPALDKELVVTAIELDTVLRSREVRVDFGGKGFNVSRMLNSLGSQSVALGFAGGHNGELLQVGLDSLGIESDFIWVDGETRTNVSIVTEVTSHYVKVNEPGPIISESAYQELLTKVGSLAHPDDWWVLSGSLPPGVPETAYADLVRIIKEARAFVLLDTSGEALKIGCEALPFLVKPNELEAQQLTGLPVDSLEEIVVAAKKIRNSGIDNVVVSLGKSGGILMSEEGAWHAATPKIDERNPIGAGDSLMGGLVHGLSTGLPLNEAFRWGVACGAATASMNGTAVGSRQLVENLLRQVQLIAFETV